MAWSSKLLEAMTDKRQVPIFILRTTRINDEPGQASYVASSLPGIGDPILAKCRVQGSMLTPDSWSSQIGGFSVELAGDLSTLLKSVVRGCFLELSIGYPGWQESDYERLAIGQLSQIRCRTPRHGFLECRDLLSALRCRPTGTAEQLQLGWRLKDVVSTLAALYTPGDPEVDISNTTGFALGSATPELACLFDGNILTYNGISGGKLQVLDIDRHGITTQSASSGTAIQPCLWLRDHPINITRQILCSELGAQANGVYDILPQGDGLGLPESWIDHEDCNQHLSLSSPSTSWEILATEPIDDVLGWMQGWLAKGGFFLTIRQGLLTVRCALPSGDQSQPIALEITDWEIESISVELWDADQSTEYARVIAYTLSLPAADPPVDPEETASQAYDPATLPAVYQREYDLTDVLFEGRADGRQDVVDRCYEAAQQIPERYTLTCLGLRAAQLCPGDLVALTSARIVGRLARTRDGLQGARGVVRQVSTDYAACRVSLILAVYPASEEVWP